MRYDPFGRGMTDASKVVSRARAILSVLVYIGLWCRVVGARLEGTYGVFVVCYMYQLCMGWVGSPLGVRVG